MSSSASTVARALAGQPRVVWADEPTGVLDSETADTVMVLLRQLNQEGLTLIVVTHDEGVGNTAHRPDRMPTAPHRERRAGYDPSRLSRCPSSSFSLPFLFLLFFKPGSPAPCVL